VTGWAAPSSVFCLAGAGSGPLREEQGEHGVSGSQTAS